MGKLWTEDSGTKPKGVKKVAKQEDKKTAEGLPSETERIRRIEANWDKLTRKQKQRYFKHTQVEDRIIKVKGTRKIY